jgi:hypothetical protein
MIRPAFMAAELLEDWNEQDEAFAMLEDFKRQTGWPIGKMLEKLRSVTWGRADVETVQQLPMATHHPNQMPEAQFESTMLNQTVGQQHLQMPQSINEVQLEAYDNATATQSIQEPYYGTSFNGHLPQDTPQSHHFHDQAQYLEASQNLISNSRPARRATIVEFQQPAYPASSFGAHNVTNYATFAPATSSSHTAFLNMTTNDAYQPTYNQY